MFGSISTPTIGCYRPLRTGIAALFACCWLLTGIAEGTERKRQRFEIATLFHPADPFFGGQLDKWLDIVEKSADRSMRLRRSRKAPGYSAIQIVQSLSAGSIDAVLLDPVGLGYRPEIAQLFGGIPFGPSTSKIIDWAESATGSDMVNDEFRQIGVKALLCGHGRRPSGVFSRDEFVWPESSGSLTIHSQGIANNVYENLGIFPRLLPAGDLYMGYASGVVDLLVSLNPMMDARTGFAQLSRYFYFPSWERTSTFAVLLVRLRTWDSMSDDSRRVMAGACQSLNNKPVSVDPAIALSSIAEQGANNTVVVPWPSVYLKAAKQAWVKSASELAARYPVLGQALEALDVPGLNPE